MNTHNKIFKNKNNSFVSCSTINDVDIVLDKIQLYQICVHFLDHEPLLFFTAMVINRNTDSDKYLLTFGEIVLKVIGGEEVVLSHEDKLTIYCVTSEMLQNNEMHFIPKAAMKNGLVLLQYGKRFAVNKDEVINFHNEHARIFERLT